MPAGRGQRATTTTVVRRKRTWQRLGGTKVIEMMVVEVLAEVRPRLVLMRRIVGDFMTCMGIWKSGVWSGVLNIKGFGCYVVEVISTMRINAVLTYETVVPVRSVIPSTAAFVSVILHKIVNCFS